MKFRHALIFAVVLFAVLFTFGCAKVSEKEVAKMPKSFLFIIAQNDFRDEELLEPKELLESEGHRVTVASITTDPAHGMLGAVVNPDIAVKDAHVDDYDAIVVIGGSGSPELAEHEEVLKLLQDAQYKGKLIGAICLGPTVLAKAGVLNGKKATVFETPDSVAVLESNGASFVKEDVVVDGNVVTASGPHAALKFGKTLAQQVS